eukprot:9844224-Ditylum_brightwellii.AAC.1
MSDIEEVKLSDEVKSQTVPIKQPAPKGVDVKLQTEPITLAPVFNLYKTTTPLHMQNNNSQDNLPSEKISLLTLGIMDNVQ